MRRLIHSLTHRHTLAHKPGIGVLMHCRHRITGRGVWLFALAEGDCPGWQPLTASQLDRVVRSVDRSQVEQLLRVGGAA